MSDEDRDFDIIDVIDIDNTPNPTNNEELWSGKVRNINRGDKAALKNTNNDINNDKNYVGFFKAKIEISTKKDKDEY